MKAQHHKRPTIGFLTGWQAYERTMLLDYYGVLMQGMTRAARERDCNLLLACGMSPSSFPIVERPALPFAAENSDFIPVGAWNTDGLIVAHPLTNEASVRSIREVADAGHPVVFIGGQQDFPTVGMDNESGIRQAMIHLLEHGHESIAFIAGHPDDMGGDSGIRLRAYQNFVRENNLNDDARLIAYGNHVFDGGQQAMREIIASGVPFTAVLASEDESAFGAIEALRGAGLNVPADIAVIGFDDAPESVLRQPPLTSVRVPVFELGRHALEILLDKINHKPIASDKWMVTPRLIVRQSCGCEPRQTPPKLIQSRTGLALHPQQLADEMQRAVQPFIRRLKSDETLALCDRLSKTFIQGLDENSPDGFAAALEEVIRFIETVKDDIYAWWWAVDAMKRQLGNANLTAAQARATDDRLSIAQDSVIEAMQRQYRQYLESQRLQSNQMGLLSSRLHAVLDIEQVYEILAGQLPEMGVGHLSVAFFRDGLEKSNLRVVVGRKKSVVEFSTREFPPAGLYPQDKPFHLALLPLGEEETVGFVVFDAEHLELYGAITQQIKAALKIVSLYQDALDGRQAAEEAGAMKSHFLSMVSHELQTPLRVVIGTSEQLMDAGGNPSLERIHASARHLESLIRDVLDLTRSDVGQLKLTRAPLDLASMLQSAALVGEQLSAEKGLTWSAEIASDLPSVWGDFARLQQVTLNLIGNAVKFTERGEVRLKAEMRDGEIFVSVSDTGIGVPPAEQKLIFGAFQQSRRTAGRKYAGLGLGLAICKQLVEMHGGRIGVESSGKEGKGSTFFYSLPLVQPEGQFNQDDSSKFTGIFDYSAALEIFNTPDALKTILVVDDEPGMLEMHAQMIQEQFESARVLKASNGLEALKVLRDTRPDLILLDLMMPEMDGFETLEAMQKQETTRAIPVVILTGQALSERDMQRLRGRVTAVMNKGLFRVEEIVSQLQRALEHRAGLTDETRELIRKSVAYIHEHYDEPLSRDDVARYVGVSAGYFSRCFHKETSISFQEYLNRYRINRARILLSQGAGNVTEVAFSVGFQNVSYFCQVFRQVVGTSPSAYQKGKG